MKIRIPNTQALAAAGNIYQRLGNLAVRRPLMVIGFWIALAAALTLAVPPLAVVAAQKQPAMLPDDAPVMVSTREIVDAFHDKGSGNIVLIVLSDEKGLSPGDESTYRALVGKLHRDTHDVVDLQDFLTTKELREVFTAKDKKAWYLPVSLTGDAGSPEGRMSYINVTDLVKKTVAGSTLTANMAGPAATASDLIDISQRDLHVIEIGTTVLVLLILLVVYRNLITMLVPLVTIGISLATAQGVLAGAAELGLGISSQTIVFMSAIIFGAGTDYAVFLISRYHDYVRMRVSSDEAVKRALTSIGKVIAASAATVAVTFFAMIFTRLPVFSTVGPALAIAIFVAFVAAVTILPAILVLIGRRGWIKPRRELTTRFWRRSGIRIVRRPKVHLVASLVVLAILASCAGFAHYNYDDRKTLPDSVESAAGYNTMSRHFPLDSIIPAYLFIHSPHDLRNPKALADLEQMAARVSQLPGVAMVRGITRPMGESLEQAKLAWQAGEVGNKLNDASQQIHQRNEDLDKLTHGADQLADALGQVREQVGQSMTGVRGVVDALTLLDKQVGNGKTFDEIDNAVKLVNEMHTLGGSLSVNIQDISNTARWAGPILAALDATPVCSLNPDCVTSRDQLRRLAVARESGALRDLYDLAQQLQSTQGVDSLRSSTQGLLQALKNAANGMRLVAGSNPGGVPGKLDELQHGAEQLADGSRQLAGGVQELVDQTRHMGAGLGDASGFLLAMKAGASSPAMGGFFIPPQILTQDDFKKAAGIFISPDGHSARYLVQTKLNPFSVAAMDQVNAITDTAHQAQPNTTLADAKISLAGISVGLRDTRDYYNKDFEFIVIATILIVFIILVMLLRAVVAPLYLILSVVISYLSALGIGVITFQFIFGQELHWSVPGLTFIILVAVGADYNLLLISRIREESPRGVRFGVIRTVSSTGGVITAAGLIFAASMFGLLFATISMMVQAGFVLGMGILLDTFLVRTVTVPAIAAMVGRANWWPSRFRPQRHTPARGAAPATATQGLESETPSASEQLSLDLGLSVVHQLGPVAGQSHQPLPEQAPLNAQSMWGSTSHRLKINSLGGREQIRVALPGSVDDRHRKHALRNYEHLARQPPPHVRTAGLPEEHTTTTLENTLDGKMPANGRHPVETNGEQPVGEHEMPLCEGWNCLGRSPLECVSKVRCARADRRLIVQSGTNTNHE
jgi:RND superfamily putative drug exporter